MITGVVIPSYKVKDKIIQLIREINSDISKIYVVDDCCPEKSGHFVLEQLHDPRVKVIFHDKNKGVGGAVKTGFINALSDGCEIIVKLDGDGQMDPGLIPRLIKPITTGKADYVKGNRFHDIPTLLKMPKLRILGNSVFSLVNKIVTGYWNVMDPTNGFIAIHHQALKLLPLDKIENRYFFESDMLFRLSVSRAVVSELIMEATYQNEKSNLKIEKYFLNFHRNT